MFGFMHGCAAGSRSAGLRTVVTVAATVSIFSIFGAAVSGEAHAQMTAVNNGLDAQIPDSPCMTPAERHKLRKMADEYNMLAGQLENLNAQIEQDSSYQEYKAADDLLNRLAEKPGYGSSDAMQAAEAAKKTVNRLDRLHKLTIRRDVLAQRVAEIKNKFFALATEIKYRKCPPPAADDAEHRIEIGSSGQKSTGPLHPFFALEGGGEWSNASFAVSPAFNVPSSGFAYGINGGVLIDIPGATFSFGPRIGWQGGNVSGSIANPPASIGFQYEVKTKSIYYQDAMVSIPIHPELLGFEKTFMASGQGLTPFGRLPFVTASAGIAEVRTEITGTAGAFQVTDGGSQTGFTGTIGVGVPISQNFLGGVLDIYTQYRFFVLPATTVSIPGQVQIDSRSMQSLNLGLEIRY